MAVGIAEKDAIFYAKATGVGNPIVYLGSKTGRDGIHGATMASAAFDENSQESRPAVQIGDPFAEKLLLEACLELMKSGAVIAIQDMGAAGLTSSAVEMGAKGDLGILLDLDAVPCREPGMSAYEMLLSESQERMLMVLAPGKEADAEAIFRKWGLDFAIIGRTTDDLRFVVKHKGEIKADLPIKELGDEAPRYDRPHVPTPKQAVIKPQDIPAPNSNTDALLRLVGSANLASKRWVYEQYDHLILGNTVQAPGGDAAVIRLGDGPKGLALTTDVNENYCGADPFEGGKQAVAEAWRNLCAVGALPLACTDNLNFGNPEKPEAMGQFVAAVEGLAEACRVLDFPIVSGNVSLYNESPDGAILPTPAIGGVGLIDDVTKTASIALQRAGRRDPAPRRDARLARSIRLSARDLRPRGGRAAAGRSRRREEGGRFRPRPRPRGRVTQRMIFPRAALASPWPRWRWPAAFGATIEPTSDIPLHAFLFGEDQGRYLLTCTPETAAAIAIEAGAQGIPCRRHRHDRGRRVDHSGRRRHIAFGPAPTARIMVAGLYAGPASFWRNISDADARGRDRNP